MKKEINLGQDKVSKIFWTYAIPSIIAMLAQTTAGLIDSIFIGKYIGPEGLSAITLFYPFVSVLIGVGAMFAIGSSTLAGIELGKKNQEKSNNYFNLAVWILSILSIVSTLLIILSLNSMTSLFNITGITKTYINDYGGTISYFYIFFMLNFVLSFFLKLDGKPTAVVGIMVSGTILNIILDYLLIVHFNMSLKGAALATGLSQLLPWVILIYFTLRKSRWQFKKPTFIKREILQIVFNGSSELLSNTAHAISGVIFNFIILNRIGVTGIAAYAVAMQITALASSFGYGFGESNQSGISFNIGANQLDRVKKFKLITLKVTISAGLLLCFFAFYFGDFASNIFVKDLATIEMASDILKYYAFSFIFMCSNIAIGTYYTAVNDPVLSGSITVYRSFIGLIIGLLIFPWLLGNDGIWVAIIFRESSTFIIGMIMFKLKPYGLNIKRNITHKKPSSSHPSIEKIA